MWNVFLNAGQVQSSTHWCKVALISQKYKEQLQCAFDGTYVGSCSELVRESHGHLYLYSLQVVTGGVNIHRLVYEWLSPLFVVSERSWLVRSLVLFFKVIYKVITDSQYGKLCIYEDERQEQMEVSNLLFYGSTEIFIIILLIYTWLGKKLFTTRRLFNVCH